MAYANDRPAKPLYPAGLMGYGRPAVVGTGRAVARGGNVTDMLSAYNRKGLGRQQRRTVGSDGNTRRSGFNLGIVSPSPDPYSQGAALATTILSSLIHTSKSPQRVQQAMQMQDAVKAGNYSALQRLIARAGTFADDANGFAPALRNLRTWGIIDASNQPLINMWADDPNRTELYDSPNVFSTVPPNNGGYVANVSNASLAPSPSILDRLMQGFFATPTGTAVATSAAKNAAASQVQKFSAALPMLLTVGSIGLVVANIASNRTRRNPARSRRRRR